MMSGRTLPRTAALVPALLLIGACSTSPPVRFYTLNGTTAETTPPAGMGWVRIAGVTIPGELDRQQLVRRLGPNQLNISELDRWAAPLDETIRRVLTDDLLRRVPNPAPDRQYLVSVDIHDFYGDAACNVTLRAAWTLKQVHAGAAAQPINEEFHVPAGGACPGALPAAMSIALGQLSDRILAGVARSPAPTPEPESESGSAAGAAAK
jgi:uncharacterized protein